MTVFVRLIRKFSESLNGVDLSHVRVGDVMSLPDKAALMLVLEGWAERSEPAPQDPPSQVST
jgi:hypothetical protein